jgi:putative heme-binding domain-containing protein
LHYMVALRNAKTGWTMDDRRRYFSWLRNKPMAQDGTAATLPGADGQLHPSTQHPAAFNQWFADVSLKPANGASYANFIKNLRKAAVANLSDNERGELAAFITDAPTAPSRPAREHKFVREWKMADLTPDLDKASAGRNFASGKEAFTATQCAACHRLSNEGGAVGPDLTGIASRFTRRDILESILDPSKVVSEQYQNSTVTKKDGDDITGRVLEENDQRVVVRTDPLKGTTVEIRKSDIANRVPSKLSPMPEGLINILTRDEILDLLAYVESGGKADAKAFSPSP